ncbi:MAG: T9SS type A sorting domain-containing protein [Bacteroidetes bacterium]|nr:T9SS type A sorting domain-containing protein [Bacteroidota bacterium]
MRALVTILIFLTNLGLFAQGWLKEMPAIPKQFTSLNGVSISGNGGNSDTIINVTSLEYGASKIKEMYVISHSKEGVLLDYFQVPTSETKDWNYGSNYFFGSKRLLIHTFRNSNNTMTMEGIDVANRTVLWSIVGYDLKDVISSYDFTYDDIFCETSNGDFEFIDKWSGNSVKAYSRDSLFTLMNSYSQKDSIYDIRRVAGTDSVQYYSFFNKTSSGNPILNFAEYTLSCNCVTEDKEYNHQWGWNTRYGFREPVFIFINENYQAPDTTFSAQIRIFNFSQDTLFSTNVNGPAFKDSDGSWQSPSLNTYMSMDGNFMVEYMSGRSKDLFGIPTFQTGRHLKFYDQNENLIQESQVFSSTILRTMGRPLRHYGQSSFIIYPDSSVILGLDYSYEAYFSGALLAKINPDGFSPLSVNSLGDFEAFSIFPNPFSSNFDIQVDDNFNPAEIVIYNIQGKEELKLLWGSGYRKSIEVSSLAPGIYAIEVRSNTGVAFRSTVIKK